MQELEQEIKSLRRDLEVYRTLAARLEDLEAKLSAQKHDISDREIKAFETRLVELETLMAKTGSIKLTSQGYYGSSRRYRRPKPGTVYAIPVKHSPVVGTKTALVSLVFVFDFKCTHCPRIRRDIDKLLRQYPNKLRVVYKYFVSPSSTTRSAALAACAADRQNKFGAMFRRIWHDARPNGDYGRYRMDRYASELRLDAARYRSDMSVFCPKRLELYRKQAMTFAVKRAPTVFINGKFLNGRITLYSLRRLIEAELKLADKRKAKPANYYDKWVLARGETRVP